MLDRRRCLVALAALTTTAGTLAPGGAAWGQRAPTPQTGTGPMRVGEAPSTTRLWQAGDPGERLHLRGRVVSTAGRPLGGAELLLWQADGTGAYQENRYRARIRTGDDGTFELVTVLPGQYWGAKHIHVIVAHPGHRQLATRILFRGDPNIDASEGDLAIPLEEVRAKDETILPETGG
jgi:protocatechuate 3,4-dioxygenase beta subunit